MKNLQLLLCNISRVQHFPAKQIEIELKHKLLTSWMLYTRLCNVLLTWRFLHGSVTATCIAIYNCSFILLTRKCNVQLVCDQQYNKIFQYVADYGKHMTLTDY